MCPSDVMLETMRFGLRYLAGVSMLAGSLLAFGQENGNWHPVSKTAKSITGELSIRDEKLTILSFYKYTIAEIRTLQPSEATAVFHIDENADGTGHLYRLNIPAETTFQHKTTLCGAEDTQWMATFVVGKTMQVAFFSGAKMPEMTPEAVGNTTELCGTYTYAR